MEYGIWNMEYGIFLFVYKIIVSLDPVDADYADSYDLRRQKNIEFFKKIFIFRTIPSYIITNTEQKIFDII